MSELYVFGKIMEFGNTVGVISRTAYLNIFKSIVIVSDVGPTNRRRFRSFIALTFNLLKFNYCPLFIIIYTIIICFLVIYVFDIHFIIYSTQSSWRQILP